MADQITLPPGYEDAKPVGAEGKLKLPPGYEDAVPVQSQNQITLPPGYEDAKPVRPDFSLSPPKAAGPHVVMERAIGSPLSEEQRASGDFTTPEERQAQPPKPKKVDSGPSIRAAKDGIPEWLENAENDILHGTDVTFPGKVLRKMGAPGLTKGTPESVGRFVGGAPLVPINA